LKSGAITEAPFLLRSLAQVLTHASIEGPARDAVGIWTHIAGQSLAGAPSPLALVPAMIHGPGCFVPKRGVAAVADAVIARALAVGVVLRPSCPVEHIIVRDGRARGVTLESGEQLEADQVVSNASGVATLLDLAPAPPRLRRRVAALPLQSPGVAAYGVESPSETGQAPYLRFRVQPEDVDAPCRLVVRPWALGDARSERMPVRIALPLDHNVAQRLGEAGQEALVTRVLDEPWIRERVRDFEPRRRLVPASWGRRHRLHEDSMNPIMTAAFMRQGRLPHRVPHVEGLFLVGSSTHPGQWVSFCLLSGIIGAEEAGRDES
jgi:phytoene dehydrogenase-like protein